MVIGIALYEFELNMDKSGEISPSFKLLNGQIAEKQRGKDFSTLLSFDHLIHLYYTLTTGKQIEPNNDRSKKKNNTFSGKIKGAPLKTITTFRESKEGSQYLTVALFSLDDDIELYEDIMNILDDRMTAVYEKIAHANLKSAQDVEEIQIDIELNLKYGIYQIERLENLTKAQRVALIYNSPERRKTLEILRHGPIPRQVLFDEISKISESFNLDLVLKPFLDLNIIRRDWVKGKKDPKTGIISGEGEYLFLIKDVILTRIPSQEIIDQMKRNAEYGSDYFRQYRSFYPEYDPNKDIIEEGRTLAGHLLNPDMFDLISLMSKASYMRLKMPKVISVFSKAEDVVNALIKSKILISVKSSKLEENKKDENELLCLLCNIHPIFIYPEYLIDKVQNRYFSKEDEKIGDTLILKPITSEIARKSFDFLAASYYDNPDA